jgi:hypothetical protein
MSNDTIHLFLTSHFISNKLSINIFRINDVFEHDRIFNIFENVRHFVYKHIQLIIYQKNKIFLKYKIYKKIKYF